MATRQYIGARYVPKFADPIEWNNARSYEGLEIVTYLGTSYTSKKNVPVGVAITNSEYWAPTGNYNAQVEQYREEVEELKEMVLGAGDRKYIFIADSYGERPTEAGGWCALLVDKLGLSEGDYYTSILSGSGFSVNGTYGFSNQLAAVVTDDDTKITDIVVAGGANDITKFTTEASLAAGIADFISYAKTRFPNASVRVANVGYFEYALALLPIADASHYFNNIVFYKKYVTLNGGYYLDGCERVLHNWNNFASDHIHPNSAGSEAIANSVLNALKNGCDIFAGVPDAVQFTGTGCTINGSAYYNVGRGYTNGDNIFVNFGSMSFEYGNNPLAVSGGNYVEIASITSGPLFCNNDFIYYLNTPYAVSGQSALATLPFTIKISKGKVYARCRYIDGSSYPTISIKTLYIQDHTAVIPTMLN